jgi:hypothetical protein
MSKQDLPESLILIIKQVTSGSEGGYERHCSLYAKHLEGFIRAWRERLSVEWVGQITIAGVKADTSMKSEELLSLALCNDEAD